MKSRRRRGDRILRKPRGVEGVEEVGWDGVY